VTNKAAVAEVDDLPTARDVYELYRTVSDVEEWEDLPMRLRMAIISVHTEGLKAGVELVGKTAERMRREGRLRK
jgi:hypothetical protein